MVQNTETPRIYVACLASYNSGTLHGRWIDCDQGEEHIREETAGMLRASPWPNVEVDCPACDGAGCETCHGKGQVPSGEEWAIHDSEGFGPLKISEYEDFAKIAELVEASEDNHRDRDAFFAWVDHEPHYNTDPERFDESFRGHWDNLEAYAEQLLDDLGTFTKDTPDILKNYFDYEAFARDLELGGDVYTIEASDGGIWVFDAQA